MKGGMRQLCYSANWLYEHEGRDDKGGELLGVFLPPLGVGFGGFDEVAGFKPGLNLVFVIVCKSLPGFGDFEDGVYVEQGSGMEVGFEVFPVDDAGVFFQFFGRGLGVLSEDSIVHFFGGVWCAPW